MLRIRHWLLALASAPLWAVGSALADETEAYRFRVMLGDREIGTHSFEVHRDAEGAEIVSHAAFDVDVMFVSVYDYKHDNREVWQDGCLQRLQSSTDDNGEDFRVQAEPAADGLRVRTDDETRVLSGCVRTFAYWDPELLQADALLNVQNGRYLEVDRREAGAVELRMDGETVDARELRLSGDDGLEIRLWYGRADGRWLGLQTRRNGRQLRYVPAEADRFTITPTS